MMYVFYKVLDYTWVLDSTFHILDNPTGNAILDCLHLEYLKLKVLPNAEIPIQKKMSFFYQWGFMPITQFLLFFVLPVLVIKSKKCSVGINN